MSNGNWGRSQFLVGHLLLLFHRSGKIDLRADSDLFSLCISFEKSRSEEQTC